MAAFCDLADVRRVISHRRINLTSNPNEALVQEFIDEVAEEMRMLFQIMGFDPLVFPPDGPTDKKLTRLNAIKAASHTERSAFAGEDLSTSDHAEKYEEEYNRWMDLGDADGKKMGIIRANPDILTDLTSGLTGKAREETGQRARSFPTHNTQGKSIANGDFDSTFRKDMQF